jgi:hypothetical protein
MQSKLMASIGILTVLMILSIPSNSYAVDPLTLSASSIPLGGTIDITFTNIYNSTLPTVSIVVKEADGDVCRYIKHNVTPGSSFTVQYPTAFNPDQGSSGCDTNTPGQYFVKSRAGNPQIPDTEQTFLTSFLVLPETPIGALAIIGSSLAGISAYTMLKRRN